MYLNRFLMGMGAAMLLVTGVWADNGTTPDLTVPSGDATAAKTAAATVKKDAASTKVGKDGATTLSEVTVTAKAAANDNVPPIKEKFDLPNTTASTTADRIDETVNILDTEDAMKYLPSLFLRKRNNGDTQAVLATRTWGVNSSARTLVYADDILISALIGNNNTNGAPRWGMVSPEEIDRIDFLYGPFAAEYPGNSIGGVLQITTKMPDKLVADFSQTEAFQTFSKYGTKNTYQTDQSNVVVGNKNGNVSWLITNDFQNSYSQPLTFVTATTPPTGTTGTYAALSKTGTAANVIGAGGLLHTQMNNTTGKVAWDISPTVKATYQADFWNNDANSTVQTYLRDSAGNATYGTVPSSGTSGFASGTYSLDESHLANSISLKTDTKDTFDWDLSASNYYYLEDIQRSPYNIVANSTSFTTNGNIARMDGTNWTNGDLKMIYRPTGIDGSHELSFGVHGDRYYLNNPTYATPTWTGGPQSTSSRYSDGLGTTMTEAMWAQDAWRFAKDFKLTVGGRLEFWEAMNGYNLATKTTTSGSITSTTTQHQPEMADIRFSPKAALSWTPAPEWEFTSSFGQAYRFPTVTELYQIVSTGTTYATPNANLKPENVLSEEISAERKFTDGYLRISGFNEDVSDALISQTTSLNGTATSFVTNVDKIRNTGIEFAGQKDNVWIHGVTLFGSATYVDSQILSDPSWDAATTVVGKRVPYVPDWRATFGTTYHPIDPLALTAALRYSGRQFSTLDNTDNTSNVMGSFDDFLVVDLHAQYKINDHLSVDAGVDNVNNDKYFLYHPFPQRTFTAAVKLSF